MSYTTFDPTWALVLSYVSVYKLVYSTWALVLSYVLVYKLVYSTWANGTKLRRFSLSRLFPVAILRGPSLGPGAFQSFTQQNHQIRTHKKSTAPTRFSTDFSLIIMSLTGSQDNSPSGNKKRGAEESPASSQQRQVRRRTSPAIHPSPGAIAGRRGLDSIPEDATDPPTTLLVYQASQQTELSFGRSVLCGSVAGSLDGGDDGEHDGTSVTSALGANLLHKFFPGRKKSEILGLGFDSVEQQLVELTAFDQTPETEDLVLAIRTDPRKSLIAQIGLTAIGEELITLQIHQARWQHSETEYASRIRESFTKEQQLLPALNAAYDALKLANEDHLNLSAKHSALLATRQSFEDARAKYDRVSKIATILLEIMETLKSGRTSEKVCILLQSSVEQSADHNSQMYLTFLLSVGPRYSDR
jgi:hypothetical protein